MLTLNRLLFLKPVKLFFLGLQVSVPFAVQAFEQSHRRFLVATKLLNTQLEIVPAALTGRNRTAAFTSTFV